MDGSDRSVRAGIEELNAVFRCSGVHVFGCIFVKDFTLTREHKNTRALFSLLFVALPKILSKIVNSSSNANDGKPL